MSNEDSELSPPVGADDHVSGNAAAPITLVEYGDYQCPYCAMAYAVVKELQRELGDSLRLVFRNMPLANVHPHAEAAAEAAEAVAEQGRFWEMHDLLYENQRDLGDAALARYATQAGADESAFSAALQGGAPRARVQRDLESALRSGANGTPTFFINGERYDGSWQLEPFLENLRSLLDD
jgi:protein-disulfide isomerase